MWLRCTNLEFLVGDEKIMAKKADGRKGTKKRSFVLTSCEIKFCLHKVRAGRGKIFNMTVAFRLWMWKSTWWSQVDSVYFNCCLVSVLQICFIYYWSKGGTPEVWSQSVQLLLAINLTWPKEVVGNIACKTTCKAYIEVGSSEIPTWCYKGTICRKLLDLVIWNFVL